MSNLRFCIRHVLIVVAIVGPAMGILFLHQGRGVILSAWYVLLTLAVWFCVRRVFVKWRNYSLISCIGAALTTTLTVVLLVCFLFNVATSSSNVKDRMATVLQYELARDYRYAGVRVEYVELKPKLLVVQGVIYRTEHFANLKQLIASRDWRGMDGIEWDLRITETATSIHSFDRETLQRDEPGRRGDHVP